MTMYHVVDKNSKANLYNSMVLRMFDNEETLLNSANQNKNDILELHTTALVFYAELYPAKLISTCEKLHALNTTHSKMSAITIFVPYLLSNINYRTSNKDEEENYRSVLIDAVEQLNQLEVIIQCHGHFPALKYNYIVIFCKSYKAAVYFLLGDYKNATLFANETSELLEQHLAMQSHYLVYSQIELFEWPIKIHCYLGLKDMINFDLDTMRRVANKEYSLDKFHSLMNMLLTTSQDLESYETNGRSQLLRTDQEESFPNIYLEEYFRV